MSDAITGGVAGRGALLLGDAPTHGRKHSVDGKRATGRKLVGDDGCGGGGQSGFQGLSLEWTDALGGGGVDVRSSLYSPN